jgi:L-ascorbate oxidase
LSNANADVPADATCMPLAANHKRRIFFGSTSEFGPPQLGLGYEEINAQGQSVPGTFIDVTPFDPTTPTVACRSARPMRQWRNAGNWSTSWAWTTTSMCIRRIFRWSRGGAVASTSSPGEFNGATVMMDTLPLIHADGNCQTVADWRNGLCTAHPSTVDIHFAVAGDFVYHGHVMSHEDYGMMSVIRVRAGSSPASAGLVDRFLRGAGGKPAQPVVPRIGGTMCVSPRP